MGFYPRRFALMASGIGASTSLSGTSANFFQNSKTRTARNGLGGINARAVVSADDKPTRGDSDLAALCEPVARLGEPSRGGCVGRTCVPCNWADMSLDQLVAHLDRARYVDGAPNSTVEALVFELRTDGIAALNDPSCLRRIEDVSTAQLREVLARLIKLRPKYPVITDDLLLK